MLLHRSIFRCLSLCIAVVICDTSYRNVAAYMTPRSYFSSVRTPQSPTDPVIADAANFAVDQLRALSDSGIYTTLSLAKIRAAATELGDFHYVIHLQVTLASPHFRSKQDEEEFEMMVLESKPRAEEQATDTFNVTRSIALNEFPVMDEEAIETFWVQMVEERRRRRKELFERWEREARAESKGVEPTRANRTPVEKVAKTLSINQLYAMSTKQLRQLLATPESTTSLRTAIVAILDERLTLLEQREEALQAQNNQDQPTSVDIHRDEL